eukprot:6085495-Amphidinium_carterae.1
MPAPLAVHLSGSQKVRGSRRGLTKPTSKRRSSFRSMANCLTGPLPTMQTMRVGSFGQYQADLCVGADKDPTRVERKSGCQ